MKPGDLVRRKKGYMGHKMCGLGLVLLVEGRRARVRWQGDYGTFMQMTQTLEVINAPR
jgi:hypothetical protein